MATYSFNGMDLRVVEIAGEPWFVAVDVCRAVGAYVRANGEVNTTMALSILDKGEISTTNPIGGRGGARPKVISESGLYKLVMRSDKKGLSESNSLSSLFGGGTSFPWPAQGEYGDRKTINARTLGIIEGKGGNPHRTFINERGLYTVVMRAHSTREGVEEFQQWVTGEVLPSIRKTGTYTMPGAKKTIEAPEAAEAKNVPPPL